MLSPTLLTWKTNTTHSGKEFSVRYSDDLRPNRLQVSSCPNFLYPTLLLQSPLNAPVPEEAATHRQSCSKTWPQASPFWEGVMGISCSPVSSKLSTHTSSSGQLATFLILQLASPRSSPYNWHKHLLTISPYPVTFLVATSRTELQRMCCRGTLLLCPPRSCQPMKDKSWGKDKFCCKVLPLMYLEAFT